MEGGEGREGGRERENGRETGGTDGADVTEKRQK